MNILWVHNFDPNELSSGSFMHLHAEGIRSLGVNLDLYYTGNLRSIKQLIEVSISIRKIAKKYDLVHAQYGSVCALVTSFVKDTPKVLTLRGSDWYVYKNFFHRHTVHSYLATMITKSVIKKFDSIVTVSERMKNEVMNFSPQQQFIVIPSPIDLNTFIPVNKQQARNMLGFSNNTDKWILFTTLSENSPIKRVQLAKQAIDIASKSINNIKLRVAIGLSREEMPLFVGACDLAISTSIYEGWPNSIKEALACNIPFVSTDISDLGMITENDTLCRICPPNAEVIAKNICDVLNSDMDINHRKYVEEMDINSASVKLVNHYRKILLNRVY